MAEWKKRPFVAATLSVQQRRTLTDPSSMQGFFVGSDGWLPPVDVYETDEQFVVLAEIGGLDAGGLEVVLQGQIVTIAGSREALAACAAAGDEIRCIHHREIDDGRFEREIRLPCPVDGATAQAGYADGLLTIRVAKADVPPPCEARSIKVD